jgi:hypothetical protein
VIVVYREATRAGEVYAPLLQREDNPEHLCV